MEKIVSYLTIDANIRCGKPCIKGTRIAVEDILQWLASGMSFADIVADYPLLCEEHIKAALQYVAEREAYTKILTAA
ncbi:hypothetical protein FACS189456_1250 [Bacteroidia bacterium]|nr:hypothetical protein FACS189456_1250 [Bacteroidia bacterium]